MHSTNPFLPRMLLGAFLFTCLATPVRAEEPIRLQESFTVGYQYHVTTRTELSGAVRAPAAKDKSAPKPLTIVGEGTLEYDERVLNADQEGSVNKTIRVVQRMEVQRKVGDQPQQSSLRPEVKRLVILRKQNVKAPFSPDGPLTWGEIDLVRTDIFTPALSGLLSRNPVAVGDRWKADLAAVLELTGLEKIEEGELTCRLDKVFTLEKHRQARVELTGTLSGLNEDGPTQQKLTGYYYFDLDSNHLAYLFLKGTHLLLDKDGKEQGKIEGRCVLTRQVGDKCKDLTDDVLKTLKLEPDEKNTLLLFDNPDQGVRFLYSRRWHVAGGEGQQIDLDGSGGAGLRISFDTAERVPTAAQFLKESHDFFIGQKSKVIRVEKPERIRTKSGELDHFKLEVEMGKERVLMAYYVAKQKDGGATLAARLPTTDQEAVLKEVEQIARSLEMSKVKK